MNPILFAAAVILGFLATQQYLNVTNLERFTMSTQAQIDALVAQLRKSHTELVGQLAAAHNGIHTQLVEAGVEDTVDLSALSAIAQALDDLTPDAEPAEIAAVDETCLLYTSPSPRD